MAWPGYVVYNGNEIINVQRTEEYARWAQLPWFKPVYKNDSLSWIIGDGSRYHSPFQDDPPWVDPNEPASYSFYGLYPLDMTGIEDSTRESTVTQSTLDGGSVGRLRHGTKAVVFTGLLIADDDAGADYGFRWLKQALLPGPCGPEQTEGSDLCYLSAEPLITLDSPESGAIGFTLIDGGLPGDTPTDDADGGGASGGGSTADYDGGRPSPPTVFGDVGSSITAEQLGDCLAPLERSLRKALVNSGPTITSKRTASDGGAIWSITFTVVAGEPWEYGSEVPVLEGFMDPKVAIPWVGGVIPEGGELDMNGRIVNETKCAQPVFAPLQDPNCPSTIPPPLPPSVPLGCYTPPPNWHRRQVTIPATYIPLWGEVVPKFSVYARAADIRNMRLRFYADVDGDGDISDDPCAYCGDIVVSYVPLGSTLVFDASERSVYAFDASQRRRRAEAVVFSTDGTPFDWPVLTCGFGYIVTVDLPQTQVPPVLDLSLFARVA